MSASGQVGLRIRRYAAGDREAVRRICYETGFMGTSVEYLFTDRESFADLHTAYYTDREPEHAWVVDYACDGRVVGYLLGCVDTRRLPSPAGIVLRHVLLRGLLFRRGMAQLFARTVGDLLRRDGSRRPPLDLDRWPGHLHVNCLPEVPRGWGGRLWDVWMEELRESGVPGFHMELMAENTRTIDMCLRAGCRKLGTPFLLPGARDRDGRRVHGQLLVMDL